MATPRPTVTQTAQLLDLLDTTPGASEEVRDPAALRAHLAAVCADQAITTTPERIAQTVDRYLGQSPSPAQPAQTVVSTIIPWNRPASLKMQAEMVRHHRRFQAPSLRLLPDWMGGMVVAAPAGWLAWVVLRTLAGLPFPSFLGSIGFLAGAVGATLGIKWVQQRWPHRFNAEIVKGREAFNTVWDVSFEADADLDWKPANPSASQWRRWRALPEMHPVLEALDHHPVPLTLRDIQHLDVLADHHEQRRKMKSLNAMMQPYRPSPGNTIK
jgi:hypothetical protein